MTDNEFLRLAINLHTRTVVGLLDAVDRANDAGQKRERLALIREAVLEFKTDLTNALVKEN